MRVFRLVIQVLVVLIVLSMPLMAGVVIGDPGPTPTPTVTPTETPTTPPPPPTPSPTVTPQPTPTIFKTVDQTEIHRSTEVHRVVQGYAKKALKPNMLDNDWDNVSRSKLTGRLSSAEERYLRSLTSLRNGVTYYADVTGRTLSTHAFRDKSVETGRKTVTSKTTSVVGGAVVITTTNVTHVYITNIDYQVVANLYDASPLVLDLNGDGKLDVAHNEWLPHAPKFYSDYALQFDITGDGQKDATEWVKPNLSDGILVRPENGKVETALQLFGTAGGYSDGFEKLALVQDTNKNGWIEGAELEGLFVWIDADSDGIANPAELHSLSDFGIKKISTRHQNYVGTFVTRDGQTHTMWDWWPATMELRKFRT